MPAVPLCGYDVVPGHATSSLVGGQWRRDDDVGGIAQQLVQLAGRSDKLATEQVGALLLRSVVDVAHRLVR